MSIRLLVMDVDGTMTDGRIYIGAQGEVMKAFDVRDGYAIARTLPQLKITPVIITGRSSAIVEQRAKELGIAELYQGISDKLAKLKEISVKYDASAEEIAYIGDDLNDLGCIQYCGMTACPADAVPEVLNVANYVCKHRGGRGAVREYIDYLRDTAEHCNLL
ncbi:MAG: HAD hydrolase family protein [Candidatus Faecousia sp.]|nr:HAD hydrolase family protein [Candidatus Faecousia sp.]